MLKEAVNGIFSKIYRKTAVVDFGFRKVAGSRHVTKRIPVHFFCKLMKN